MDATHIAPGDILAFSGHGFVSGLINLGTFALPGRGASHVGIVSESTQTTGLFMFESTMLFGPRTPCRLTGTTQDGVRAVYLEDALARKEGRIYHYPLRVAMSPYARYRLSVYLESVLGLRYDLRGAAHSGGFLLRNFFRFVRPSDLSRIFCSELTAAAHKNAGILDTKHPGFYNPNAFLRSERRQAILLKPMRIR